MEPTLHCARPEFGCEGGSSDRVLANRFIYHFRDPHRGEIIVFHAPKLATRECTGGIFVKRVIGLPGEVWAERDGYTYIDGRRLSEPYIQPGRRDMQTKTLLDIPPTRTTVRRPRGPPSAGPPTPPQLDQKMSERSAPMAPTASRIQPIVCSSRPLTVALTAQIRMAPAAISTRLTPIPMFSAPFR